MAISATIKETVVHIGDIIRVHTRIVEGEKERIQIFEGMVIVIRGRGENRSFTVRKIAVGNIGVERIFPFITPWVTKIEVKKLVLCVEPSFITPAINPPKKSPKSPNTLLNYLYLH